MASLNNINLAKNPEKIGIPAIDNKEAQKPSNLFLAIISGPEPQRTILENNILIDLEAFTKPVVLIRGLPTETEPIEVPPHVTVFNHLDTIDLALELQQADYIICRGGYTSLMELLSIDKKLIVVPTPGQTEQTYLADQLHKANRGTTISQDKLILKEAIKKAELTAGLPKYKPNIGEDLLMDAVQDLLILCEK